MMVFLGFYVKLLDVKWIKEYLLIWFFYLGYVLLIVVLVVGVIVIGCICVKCCWLFCVSKGNDDDDDENWDENLRRFVWNLVFLVNNL